MVFQWPLKVGMTVFRSSRVIGFTNCCSVDSNAILIPKQTTMRLYFAKVRRVVMFYSIGFNVLGYPSYVLTSLGCSPDSSSTRKYSKDQNVSIIFFI